MIDTSLALAAPMLAGQRLHYQSFVPADEAPANPDHGTAIAALLVGRSLDSAHPNRAGLLPAADLYAASVFGRLGERSQASAVGIAAALDWMVANRVPVVNVSLSGEANDLLALAVERAAERGTLLVAAAGNGGPGAPPAYPGAYGQVIAVTAVDKSGAVFAGANRGDYVAFAAPGVRIWTPGRSPFGEYQTGTSFAAPFAAAAAAVALMSGTPAEPQALKQLLARHSVHLGDPGKNPVYGYGLLKAPANCDSATASVK
jgi:subtilisin family serine protease